MQRILSRLMVLKKIFYETISADFSILDAKTLTLDIMFQNDDLGLKDYILSRMNRFDYNTISENIEISIVPKLLPAPSTTISIERSFSILGKVLTKERRFSDDSVKHYMMLYYNKL